MTVHVLKDILQCSSRHLLHKDHLGWMGSLCPIFPQNSMPLSECFFSDSFFPVIQDCYSSLCSILLNCVSLLSRGCMFCPLLSLRTGPSPGPDQESVKNDIELCAWSELLLPSMPCLQGFQNSRTCARTLYPSATLPCLCSCPQPPASGRPVTRSAVLLAASSRIVRWRPWDKGSYTVSKIVGAVRHLGSHMEALGLWGLRRAPLPLVSDVS